MLGISIGTVNSTTKTDLNRILERFSIHAKAKDSRMEMMVANTVVTSEFFSIGQNWAEPKTSVTFSPRMVENSVPMGNTTVTSR